MKTLYYYSNKGNDVVCEHCVERYDNDNADGEWDGEGSYYNCGRWVAFDTEAEPNEQCVVCGKINLPEVLTAS